jgi:aromatic ring-opening dioxygenase LigB subunit
MSVLIPHPTDERRLMNKSKAKALTEDELQRFGESVSDALTIVIGVLAQVVGSRTIALNLLEAMEGRKQVRPDHVRDSLLSDALVLALVKARNDHPDDQPLQSLAASVLGSQTKQ